MPFLTTLLILLIAARLLGEAAARLGQPAILGEILAGVVLGPTALRMVEPSMALSAISELAVFLIIMESGLEMDFREVVANLRGKGLLVAACGFLVPLASGIALGNAFALDAERTLFLGLCLSITALPVALRILESLDLQKTEIARYAIGAAIFSDIAALLALGVILSLPEEATFGAIARSIAVTGSKLVAFAAVVLAISLLLDALSREGHALHRAKERFLRLIGPEALFGATALFVLAFSTVSEILGFHFVIGAFFGALLLSHALFGAKRFSALQKTLGSISSGFLAPVFFAALGLQIQVEALKSVGFVGALIALAIASKVVAGFVAGRAVGLPWKDALQVGAVLNGRGVMGVVIADIALQKNFIGAGLFATLILMSVVTTALTPMMIRQVRRL